MRDSEPLIVFGVYEVDVRTGELRKQGCKLKLQEQPFQVLAMLLEQPGGLVTREELRTKLWLADTFVDFDHGLNSAINKIREALGDSADNPRFVETVPRRGYRFIAPVRTQPEDRAAEEPIAAALAPVEPGAADGSSATNWRDIPREALESTVEAVIEVHGSRVRWARLAKGLAAATAGLVVVLTLLLLLRPPHAAEVLGFHQLTNDGRQKVVSFELGSPVLTDGARLYFTEWENGATALAQVAIDGGETALLSAPSALAQLAGMSPHHSELLITGFKATEADAPLWIVPIPAGAAHRVDDLTGHDGTWSPDAQRLIYAKGHDLYVARADGSGSRRLVSLPGMAYWPRWSPDGRVLRFSINDPVTDSDSLWQVSASGGGLQHVFPAASRPPDACCGDWTPNGKYFIFESSANGKTDLWAVREKGSLFHKATGKPVPLTAGPMNFGNPLPGADGKTVFAVGVERRGELEVYNPKLENFVDDLGGISAEETDFSRDGAWVTYAAYPQGTVWRSRADGTERRQLSFPPMLAALPRWSPDGKTIAFMGQMPGRPWKIYLISPSGGAPEQLLPGEDSEADPNWSPDGKFLVLGGAPWAEAEGRARTSIQVADLRTRQVSTLPGSEGLFSPRWSPDGCCLVALPADSQKLVLFDFSTRKWQDLAHIPADYPAWSHNGDFVYFASSGRRPAIQRVRASDGTIERLVELKAVPRAFGTFGPWFGLGPDDSLLVLRDSGSQEIYTLDLRLP